MSLAVWMAGVIYEIDLLRRASSAGDSAETSSHHHHWTHLCDGQNGRSPLTVVVDVISGTSAGGLNGTLLATAIARGTTLDSPPGADTSNGPWLRQLWVDLAAITPGALIPEGKNPDSILDGDYFHTAIVRALRELTGAGGAATDPMTLFVTASVIGPSTRHYTDAFGTTFAADDHRRLYRFERAVDTLLYRHPSGAWCEDHIDADDGYFLPDKRDDFLPESAVDRLALAARASASFPLAFCPVRESDDLNAEPPRILPSGQHPPGWLTDGGLLDNSPFTPVVDAITRRAVDSPVERLLIYIVPSNATTDSVTALSPHGPTWHQVLSASTGLVTETDFRADIEQIHSLLRDNDVSWSETQRLFADILADSHKRRACIDAAIALVETFRRARAAGGVRHAWLLTQTSRATPLSPGEIISADDVDTLLAMGLRWVPHGAWCIDGSFPETQPWHWGVLTAEHVLRLMMRYLRMTVAHQNAPQGDPLWGALANVDRQLRRAIAVRDAVDHRLTQVLSGRKENCRNVAEAINTVLDELWVPQTLGAVVSRAAQALSHVVPCQGQEAVNAAIAVEVIAHCLTARLPLARNAAFTFLRLGPDVTIPVVGVHDPQAAHQAASHGEHKLYGTQAFNFGAFGRPEWRRWDWLCGRLDAITHLGKALGMSEEGIVNAQRAVLIDEETTVEEFAHHLEMMRNINLSILRQELIGDAMGRASLTALGDRMVELFHTPRVDSHPFASGARWIYELCRRDDQPSGRSRHRFIRWVTHPARSALWQRLSPSAVVQKPRTPWYVRLWPYGVVVAGGGVASGSCLWIAAHSHGIGAPILASIASFFAGVCAAFLTVVIVIRVLRHRLM